MANTNTVFGARVVGTLPGSPYAAKVRHYAIPASDPTALYVGDVVKGVQGFTEISTQRYLPTISQAAATNMPIGIVVGFIVDPSNLTLTYRPASTLREVLVVDDPFVIFEIQSTGTAAASEAERLADIIVGSGGTIFSTSGMQLDHATIGSGTTLRILGLSHRIGADELGIYTKYLCMFAKHQHTAATGL